MQAYEGNSMNWEKLSQSLFDRLTLSEKLEILKYIQSEKHEITLERELRW